MKNDIEQLMRDMAKDLFVEYTEEDFIAMEKEFFLNKKNKEFDDYKDFLESSKHEYDYEEREEI